MKLTFKHRPGYLFSLRVLDTNGDEVVMSYSVDDILKSILVSKQQESGIITYSTFKSSKPCIGVCNVNCGDWKVVYSNIEGVEVNDPLRICMTGFKKHVGALRSKLFKTHYFIIETDESTTVD